MRYVLVVVGLLLLGGGGYWGWQRYNAPAAELEQMLVATVQRGDIEDLVTATGNIQPHEFVDVGAQVSGQLKKIHVEVGSVVKTGDLLAEIDPTVYAANVDGRRAQLRNLKANLAERESALTLAQLQLTRQKNMLAGDATTVEQMQSAEAQVRATTAQVAGVRAQIEQTESTLRAEEANLNYARIYSPITGVVVSINARQGQTLNANQQAPVILRVADLSTMTVQTQVSEADVSRLRPGMEVYFTTLGSRNRRWTSTLSKVEPTPSVANNVVLYNALFDVANDQRNLLPQMTAQVFFVAAAARDTLLVPAGAIVQRRNAERRDNPAGREPRGNPPAAPVATPPSAASVVGDEPRRRPPSGEPPLAAAVTPATAPSAGLPDPAQWRNLSREERRAMMEQLTPEQRQQWREQRRAENADPAAKPPVAAAPPQNGNPPAPAVNSKSSGNYPVWAGVASPASRQPREAIVKVVNGDGKVVERTVQIGISNRVQVQILAGLNEGEKVVAGVKPPPGAQRAQRNNTPQAPGGLTPPGGMGAPGAPGAPGAGRSR